VSALDEQIGGRHDATIGYPQHGGVVAGTDEQSIVGRQQGLDRCDQPELTEVGDGDGGLQRLGASAATGPGRRAGLSPAGPALGEIPTVALP
jgi:hypothetical protein